MKRLSCPSSVQLTRALSVGADERLRAHLATCERCAREWAAMKRLIALGRQIEVSAPGAARCDELRTEILARSESLRREPSRRRAIWALAATCAVACSVALFVIAPWDSEPERVTKHVSENATVERTWRGTIHPLGNARFARVSPQPDEVVRLFDGSLSIEVDPLGPQERFRVVTSDAEVEVHGTVFEVTARADRLAGVSVSRGRVAVRAQSGKAELLIAPAGWKAAPPPAAEKVASNTGDRLKPRERKPARQAKSRRRAALDVPPVTTEPVTEAPVAADPAQPDQAELAFREGWNALRSGNPGTAAAAFRRVEQADPPSPLVEDAYFWRGVALKRAGRVAQSIAELSSFLERFPGSARAGEASAMLGWMLLEDGRLEAARRSFERAQDDPVDRVRASARRGLVELEKFIRPESPD